MRPLQALLKDLKQVLWAFPLIFLFSQVLAYYRNTFLVCLAADILTAVAFMVIPLCNVAWFIVDRKTENKQLICKD